MKALYTKEQVAKTNSVQQRGKCFTDSESEEGE